MGDTVQWKENGRIKLMIIVGTRPEIIRLAAVIKKCRKYFDTILVHTGQNYDYNLNGVFFRDLGLADPELYLNAVGADKKALVVLPEADKMIVASFANIAGVKTSLYNTINVYDILNADKFVVTKEAVEKLEEVYA